MLGKNVVEKELLVEAVDHISLLAVSVAAACGSVHAVTPTTWSNRASAWCTEPYRAKLSTDSSLVALPGLSGLSQLNRSSAPCRAARIVHR